MSRKAPNPCPAAVLRSRHKSPGPCCTPVLSRQLQNHPGVLQHGRGPSLPRLLPGRQPPSTRAGLVLGHGSSSFPAWQLCLPTKPAAKRLRDFQPGTGSSSTLCGSPAPGRMQGGHRGPSGRGKSPAMGGTFLAGWGHTTVVLLQGLEDFGGREWGRLEGQELAHQSGIKVAVGAGQQHAQLPFPPPSKDPPPEQGAAPSVHPCNCQ